MREQFFATYPEDHAQAGEEISRAATCSCGAIFTQRVFSERFLEICERVHATDALLQQMPGLWAPAHCPACERVEIRQLERASRFGRVSRRIPEHPTSPEPAAE